MQQRAIGRRAFLVTTATAAVGIAGCGDDDEGGTGATETDTSTTRGYENADVVLDFAEPTAVLNYAYALEQLEAAFYAQVNENLYSGASSKEKQLLQDIGAHEIVHADFFKAVLGDDAVGALEVNFSEIDFDSRDSVLSTALTFENLGVGAYNGAAKYIDINGPLGTVPLEAAGDIVSVEARHASTIGAQIEAGRGGFRVEGGFDDALEPSAVLEAAAPFLKTTIALRNVPGGTS